jgi:succinylglutamic semialdehyde dehydrogenase
MQFIDGQWFEGDGEEFVSINPANGKGIWRGHEASADQVNQAVLTAKKAFDSWARLTSDARKVYLENFVSLLQENKEHLSLTLSRDTGKVLWEARLEIATMINKFDLTVQAYQERCTTTKNVFGKSLDTFSVLRYKPHGVVAVFGPYNFPGHVPNGHIMPALLAGNTVVYKPSELTPLITEEIVRLWHQSGLPSGVLNLVQGKSNTGIALANHPMINGIFFTGSSKTGKLIHKNYGGNPSKILALELGGNNPLLVFDVNNIQAVVNLIINSAFNSAGQRCTCARRLILPKDSSYNQVIDLLVEVTGNLKIGDPKDESNFMGPLISSQQAMNIIAAQSSLIDKGAKPLLLAKNLDLGAAFVSPGILDCTEVRDPIDEEFFGPILQVYRVDDWQSAITLANATNYGLSAGLISDNKDLYRDFFLHIDAGLIYWNNQLTGASSSAPFGGIKDSGNFNPSGYFAVDYCTYPVASVETEILELPTKLSPGLKF